MNRTVISKATLTDLEERLEQAAYAPTKPIAKPILDRLRFDQSQLASQIPDPYLREKLSKAIIYAAEASGQVRSKDHWIGCMRSEWYVFKAHVNNTLPSED